MIQKRTKIIATIGPASHDKETLTTMVKAGMNVARFNFSHGTYASHSKLIANIRAVEKKLRTSVGIIADLSGSKLRLGEFKTRVLKKDEHIVLGAHGIPVQRHIWQWVKPGQTILIDDGLVELVATKINPDSVESKVLAGGTIISHKGVSLPGVKVDLPVLSEKDLQDLEFALKMGVDYLAMSFVKSAADIKYLKSKIKKIAGRNVPVIAKIETAQALKNINQIIKEADAIMVARGDLALNIAQELVPVAAKNIVKKCIASGTPVIMATQMLESMTHNPRPTRAEMSDVANAVIDHVDCVMLSGETAFGDYPLKSVETMSRIIAQAELSHFDDLRLHKQDFVNFKSKDEVLAYHLLDITRHSRTNTLVVGSLQFAKLLSRFRQEHRIIFVTKNEKDLRQACLLWSVAPVKFTGSVASTLKNLDLVKKGERFLNFSHSSAHIQLMH